MTMRDVLKYIYSIIISITSHSTTAFKFQTHQSISNRLINRYMRYQFFLLVSYARAQFFTNSVYFDRENIELNKGRILTSFVYAMY